MPYSASSLGPGEGGLKEKSDSLAKMKALFLRMGGGREEKGKKESINSRPTRFASRPGVYK